ncbi:MAG: PEGA domain-containing protein [Planctomycetales bacterium]|nr:PEGA domain-containing protein [Planctomycetales bacterium]
MRADAQRPSGCHVTAAPRSRNVALRRRAALAALALVTLIASPGCVRRRLLVRSNPPGATVYVDNQPVGVTPCATSFTYYGTREIRLVKAGYETKVFNQPIPAPWYELPPFDFISENLVPREIQDYRTVNCDLQPQVVVPTEHLLARAEELRLGAMQDSARAVIGATDPWSGTFVDPAIVGPSTLGPAIPSNVPMPTPVAPQTNSAGVVIAPNWGGAVPTPSQSSPAYGSPTWPAPPTPNPSEAASAIPGGQMLPPGGMPLEALPPPQ